MSDELDPIQNLLTPPPGARLLQVLAAIMIVYGGIGLLTKPFSLLFILYNPKLAAIAPEERLMTMISTPISMVTAGLLLMAGIGLLRRHLWAWKTGVSVLCFQALLTFCTSGFMTLSAIQKAQSMAAADSYPMWFSAFATGFGGFVWLLAHVAFLVLVMRPKVLALCQSAAR